MEIADFIKGFNKIVFDMDGVITSEQNYWNTASLTVYELLNSEKYFGKSKINIKETEKNMDAIRKEILYRDKLIALLKEKGINSNWDLAYVILCFSLFECKGFKKVINLQINDLELLFNSFKYIYKANNFEQVYKTLRELKAEGFELYDLISEKFSEICEIDRKLVGRDGILWQKCQDVFQEWYLGEKMYIQEYSKNPSVLEKNGLMNNEEPIIPINDLKKVLKTLYDNNITLGIGTGRVYTEIHAPLKAWGIEKYFDRNLYITYTDIVEGEKNNNHILEGKHLTKPHPFMFLKGIFGRDYPEEKLLRNEYDNSIINKTLIVGDAGSDIMAAQAIGCKFAAVLTGVSGKKAKKYFQEMQSDYILDSICDLLRGEFYEDNNTIYNRKS